MARRFHSRAWTDFSRQQLTGRLKSSEGSKMNRCGSLWSLWIQSLDRLYFWNIVARGFCGDWWTIASLQGFSMNWCPAVPLGHQHHSWSASLHLLRGTWTPSSSFHEIKQVQLRPKNYGQHLWNTFRAHASKWNSNATWLNVFGHFSAFTVQTFGFPQHITLRFRPAKPSWHAMPQAKGQRNVINT